MSLEQCRQDPPTIESLLLDRELLENLVWRLNVELGRYETRLQQLEKEFIPDKYNNASETAKNTSAPAWCRADPATLGPLLQAYDEALLEKDQLINNFEQQLHKLGAEFREEVAENERLHEALEELLKKESDAREEAEMAQTDVNNLHSENVILLEKLEIEKTKNEEMGEDYGAKLAQMQEQEALVIQKSTELNALGREYGILEQKLVRATLEMEQRIPVKHHEDSIADCRKLLEQLKQSYNEDRKVLEERNKVLLVEKVNAETKIRSLVAEAAQNEARALQLKRMLHVVMVMGDMRWWVSGRRTEARSEQLQTRLVGAESCRDSSVRELRQLMAVAERLATDQETLLQQLQLHQGTNRRLSALRTSLKSVQKELPEIERQLKAQESGVERLRGDHQREMVRLHSLLRHKDQAIKQLQRERDSTCEQLDIVWRAAEFESLKFADKGLCQPHSLPETHRKISRED
ncbi:hypothetical protein B566_EDAN012687 [Ephemera danica]|nr:hypothetical protein B566_EDAN012687 [Ephemera danica]